MANKFYYKVDVSGKNGYSFMISTTQDLMEDEVIRVSQDYELFLDEEDVNYAVVDDLVTNFDIKAFGDNIIDVEV